ncbi:MAG: dynamin family protein [Firmicutes bacterium]|nr:dynamin family protein [Gammaproteobacteria bacterium]MCL5050378.1 dynamin family protein [Bacillota bacterium]
MANTFSPAAPPNGWAVRVAASIVPAVKRTLANYVELKHQYEALSDAHQRLYTDFEALEAREATARSQLAGLNSQLTEKQTALDEATDELEHKQLALNELGYRFDLVSTALSARTVHSEKYERFQHLLHQEMLPFANTVNVLANEAEAVTRLRAVDDQLRLLDSMAKFQSKTVVAVSGGFSSGKSSFISSLFTDNQIQLPIGVQPVTAIPTYVFHSDQNRIMGYSKHGGKVEIEPSLYSQLSHDMIQQFDFNLRDLLPFVALQTPLERHQHLAFIDLPGYNPGEQTEATAEDEASASEFMAQAQCVLWVIGLDANGTISRPDIEFLYQHAQHTRLYIVLNKADLKPLSDVQSVLEEVADTLHMEGIPFEGISAYSSEWANELAYEQQPLAELLESWNQPKDTYKGLLAELDDIFGAYEQAFVQDIQQREGKLSLVKALELDLFELGAFEEQQLEIGFDIKQYRSKSKRGQSNKAKPSGFMGAIASLYGFGKDSSVYGSAGKATTGLMNDSCGYVSAESAPEDGSRGQDPREQRLDKIGSVKQHLGDLRTAYNVAERQEQLKQLKRIWQDMRELFT